MKGSLSLGMLLACGVAWAHPEFVGDRVADQQDLRARPPQQRELNDRYALQGTWFFGSPVHEEMTIRSLERSGALGGRSFDPKQDAPYIRGVFWNDDPTALLWDGASSTTADTWGIEWYREFSRAKREATAPGAVVPGMGAPLIARSHFGDLQFLHGMATRDGVPAEQTHAGAMLWAEFCYRVAVGEIPGSTRLLDVPVAGLAALFSGDAALEALTVEGLLRHADVRKVAAGSLLHLIQDSFADGHVERERKDRAIEGRMHFGRGSIRSFHSYTNQDEKLHARDDKLPVTLALGSASGTGEDPVTHGAALLRLMFVEKRPDGRVGADWSVARKLLVDQVFQLPAAHRQALSGPGAYARAGARDDGARDAEGSRKVALLVGVGRYKSDSVRKLNGPANDVVRMKALLVSRYGFRERDVRVLLDEQATREAILKGLDELAGRAAKDAASVFYFSGHGSQKTDLDGDEADDGMDETLLAHDSRTRGADGVRVDDVVDDEVNARLNALGRKTRNVLVILDSCHSGTGVRMALAGTARFMDPDPAFATPKFPPGRTSRAAGAIASVRDGALEYVLFSGSRSDELSYEVATPDGPVMGALTYQFARALEANADPKLTYRTLWEDVRARVNAMLPAQNPQAEGRLDRAVLAVDEFAPRPYFAARAVEPKRAVIDAGRAHGVTIGSEYALHQPGATAFDDTDRLGTVTIVEVTAYNALGRLDSGALAQGVLRAVERVRASGDYRLRVLLDAKGGAQAEARVRKAVSAIPGVTLVAQQDNPQLVLRLHGDVLHTLGLEGAERGAPLRVDAGGLKQLEERLLGLRKWFRTLDAENGAGGPAVSMHVARTGLQHDEVTRVVVRNDSPYRLYFSLLDLAQDGAIGLIKLDKRNYAAIDPGRDLPVDVRFQIPGRQDCYFDVLKLVVTDQAVDFSGLTQPAARDTKGINPLLVMLGEDAAGRQASAVASESWTTRQAQVKVSRPGTQCP